MVICTSAPRLVIFGAIQALYGTVGLNQRVLYDGAGWDVLPGDSNVGGVLSVTATTNLGLAVAGTASDPTVGIDWTNLTELTVTA